MSILIEVRNLKKVYRVGSEKVVALDNINLNIEMGEICCLLGTSGSGKSTLLNMLAGLEKPTCGEIIIDSKHVEKMEENKMAMFRRKNVGFVFQSYNLMPYFTAIENVALPLIFNGIPRQQREKRAQEMLELVGLKTRIDHKPSQMSGGQQQRVGIARAFVTNPRIIFADEPTGNLDSNTTSEIMGLITARVRENKQTLILVTHDKSIASYADRIIYILDGKIAKTEIKQGVEYLV